MHIDAFMCWAETSLTPRVWAVCDDARYLVQRSEVLVRSSRALLRRYREEKLRQRAFEDLYVPRPSGRPNDKLLAIVNHHQEMTVDALPSAYYRACRAWFNNLSLIDRITATLASRIYLDGNAAAAERIAARLPSAPSFPFPAAAVAPTSVSRHRRSGYWKRGRRPDG